LYFVEQVEFLLILNSISPSLSLFLKDGGTFKATIPHYPYFYLGVCERKYIHDVEVFLKGKFESIIHSIELVEKVDLDMKNHLAGLTRTFLKISFYTVQNLLEFRSYVLPIVQKNNRKEKEARVSLDDFMSSPAKKRVRGEEITE